LKEAREVAVVTLVGRLFYAQAAVTRKDLPLMVRSCILGMIRHCWEPDRSHRSNSASSVHWISQRSYGTNNTDVNVHIDGDCDHCILLHSHGMLSPVTS